MAGCEPRDPHKAGFPHGNLTVRTSAPRDTHSHFTDAESEAPRPTGMQETTQYGTGLGVELTLSSDPVTDGYCASGPRHQQPSLPHPQEVSS